MRQQHIRSAIMDHRVEAIAILEQWLIEQLEDADLLDVLNSSADSEDLTDEEFDLILDNMKSLRLVSVHLQ